MSKEVKFKLQISIRRADDDGPVFQKKDGERFDKPITIKLNVETKYNLLFTTRPAMDIKKVNLKGENVSLELQKREKPDDKALVYHADWSTENEEVTRSNVRIALPFLIEMTNGLTITPTIQAKLYPEKELSHSKWGQEFHLLDIECIRKGETSALQVEEQYI